MPSATFSVTVEWSHVSGKFAPRDDIIQAVQEALEGAEPDLSGIGPDGCTEYNVDSFTVEEQVAPPKPKRSVVRVPAVDKSSGE